MIRFYSPIFLLQMFCLYHAYSNNTNQKWYLIIVFFPFFGSLIYLYNTFYSQENMDDLSEGIKNTFVTNYKIDKLEKQLVFSDTVVNRITLADEHSLVGNHERALELYLSCLDGVHEDDLDLLLKIVKTSYLLKDYSSTIKYGEKLMEIKEFQYSDEKIALAWAYYYEDQPQRAEQIFKETDVRFSNYNQRMEFAKYFEITGRKVESKELLTILLEEIDAMGREEKRQKKTVYRKIQSYVEELEHG